MADEGYTLIQRDPLTGDMTTATSSDGTTFTTTSTTSGTASSVTSAAPVDVTYQNTWTSYNSAAWRGAHYAKSGDLVIVSGIVKTSAATPLTTIFTLPSGYRPSQPLYFDVAISATTIGAVVVQADGQVKHITGAIVANTGFMSLKGIVYYADGS